jgi:hypothetical protein
MPIQPALNIELQDEGTSQGRVRVLNVTGAGATASVAGSVGTINIPGGGGGGGSVNTGTAELDFGAFPGATDASLAVTGQASIVAGSAVWAVLIPVATADHTADEHLVDGPIVLAGNIIAGTGFTLYGKVREQQQQQRQDPFLGRQIRGDTSGKAQVAATITGLQLPNPGGTNDSAPMLYGRYSVRWFWF